jgi:hypothetical protein
MIQRCTPILQHQDPVSFLHEFSFEDFKLFAIAPPNEDLVTGGDVVLAFDRVVKQVES